MEQAVPMRRSCSRLACGLLLLGAQLFCCARLGATIAFDAAGHYAAATWTNGSNGGTGFGPWKLFAATQDLATAFGLGSSTNAGGWNLDSSLNRSFGLLLSTQATTFRTSTAVRSFSLQTNEAVFCKAVMNNDGSVASRVVAISAGNPTNFAVTEIVCGVSLSAGVAGVPDGFQVVHRSGAGLATNLLGSLAQLGPNVFFWCMRTGPTSYVYDVTVGTNRFAGAFQSANAPVHLWFRNSATNSQAPRRVLHFNDAGVDRLDPGFRILGAAGSNGLIAVTYPSDPYHYYVLLRGSAATAIATAVQIHLPETALDAFTHPMPPTNSFFAVSQGSRFLPGDLDGDGMDDVYEVLGGFNALDPSDGPALAVDGSGLTNYQEYRMLMGFDLSRNDAISRELSVFRTGGTNAAVEAISREASVFKSAATSAAFEAISREASVFRSGGSAAAFEAISRELSVFIPVGVSPAHEAVSREVSVFGLQGTNAAGEAISREVSIFGLEGISAAGEAISREVSIFSLDGISAVNEAVSREASVFSQGGVSASVEAISREVSVFSAP